MLRWPLQVQPIPGLPQALPRSQLSPWSLGGARTLGLLGFQGPELLRKGTELPAAVVCTSALGAVQLAGAFLALTMAKLLNLFLLQFPSQ